MDEEIPQKGELLMVDDLGQLGKIVNKIWFRSGKNFEINESTFKVIEFTDDRRESTLEWIINQYRGEGFSFLEKYEGRYP